MSKPLTLAPHLSHDELEQRFKQCKHVGERTRWHALWLVSGKRSARQVAALLGVAPSSVSRWVNDYNRFGPDYVRDHRRDHSGRPRLISKLTDAQLDELRRSLASGQAPPEVGGGLWDGTKVARWLEQALGRAPDSMDNKQGWRTLRQLGFSLQRPRPKHPDGDKKAQEAFKGGASPNA